MNAPAGSLRVTTVDAHTAGEPLRLITGGFPAPTGSTMLERRANARANHDALRRALMWEPRGHADMYGALLTEPGTEDGDAGVLFFHNEGFSTMCGHGVIAVVTLGLEFGLLPDRDPLRLDTPAGRVVARARRDGARVTSVAFENVPAFLLQSDLHLNVDGVGHVRCDVAFGGAFYAFVDARQLGVALVPEQAGRVIELGRRVSAAVRAALPIAHPEGEADLGFLYGTILFGRAHGDAHSRHACVFADGELDRSPTGTGVSARAAILHARGELGENETVRIESILGTSFAVRVTDSTACGELPAVITEVEGSAWATGRHEFWIAPDDPLAGGFLLR